MIQGKIKDQLSGNFKGIAIKYLPETLISFPFIFYIFATLDISVR